MTSELKPCPFCGGEAEIRVGSCGFAKRYWVCCKNKSCQGRATKSFGAEHAAIRSWNKRADKEVEE